MLSRLPATIEIWVLWRHAISQSAYQEPFCRASFEDVQTAKKYRKLHSFVNGKRESFHLFGTWGIGLLEFLFATYVLYLYQIVNTKDLFQLHEVLFCRLFHNPHSKASSLILKMELHLSNSRRCILFRVHFVLGAILYRYQYITQGQRSPFVVVGVWFGRFIYWNV